MPRGATVVITVALTAAATAGCGSGGHDAIPGPADTGDTSDTSYDITRIGTVADAFPPGFTVTEIPLTTLTEEQAAGLGGISDTLSSLTFDPPECNGMLKSPHVVAGGRTQGVLAEGPQEITVMAAESADAGADAALRTGCDHVTIRSPGLAEGTIDRIPSPDIDGVTTAGLRSHLDVTLGEHTQTLGRIAFLAPLDERTAVMVLGAADPALLSDLLVQGVAAVRGATP